MKTYKFRIYPNQKQKELLGKTFGSSRFIYNYMLNLRISEWEENGKSLSCFDCAKKITELKNSDEFSWLKEVDSIALQSANENLNKAFLKFFKEKKGFPKFKKKYAKQSYVTKNVGNSIKIEGNSIKLPKLGFVRFAKSREIVGTIKTVAVSMSPTRKYYISVTTDYVPTASDKWAKNKESVGIDLGLTHFAVFDDGTKIPNPRHYKKYKAKLAKEQRILSRRYEKAKAHNRKLVDCKNYQKQKIKVAKVHEKIKNVRTDFLQKLSTEIVKNHAIICIENLSVANMKKNQHLAAAITDVSWSEFVSMLKYKSDWHDRELHQVGKTFPSSQICSTCHELDGKKPLNVRKWTCKNCGAEHDRDINAAINILIEGTK